MQNTGNISNYQANHQGGYWGEGFKKLRQMQQNTEVSETQNAQLCAVQMLNVYVTAVLLIAEYGEHQLTQKVPFG